MHTIAPADLLTLLIGSSGVRNTNLIDSTTLFGDLGGDLRFKAEAVFLDRNALDHLAPEDLVTNLHIRQIEVGEYIIIECYRKLDPTTWTDIYDDLWLKKYSTALIKRQWGQNLSKFNGVTMLGGVTMNGAEIFGQAQEEINKLEDESKTTWEEPIMFSIG